MKRRLFLGSALGAAGAVALGSAVAAADVPDTSRFDFVIVGAGTAGLPAAIFASRRGAKVLLIDAASDIGGTLHLANGQVSAANTHLQIAKGIKDSPQQHYEDVMALSRGHADPDVVRLTAEQAPATVNWLLDGGLKPLADHPVTGDSPGRKAYSVPRYLWGAGEGRDILAVLRRELAPEVASGRVTLQLDTRIQGLLLRGGRVVGVRASGFEAYGRHVLVTTGGYAMNPALFKELSGVPAYAAGSYPHSQGDALQWAREVGAPLRGQSLHRPGTGSVLTAREFPAKVYVRFETRPQRRLPWEIWVNEQGRRFIREDEPLVNARTTALLEQSNLRYHIVFDQAILDEAPPGLANWSREKLLAHFNSHPMFVKADSLAELAQRAGIAVEALQETVSSYNRSVALQADFLGREHLPRSIVAPPFYAICHMGHSATSSTGLVVDKRLRVVDAKGEPIEGLYAAGEVLGSGATLGDAFAPGMMLTPALALGRWLGLTLPLA
jgi:fumarate reductase flavoprotein subunit